MSYQVSKCRCFVLLVFFICAVVYPQKKQEIFNNSLWIKNDAKPEENVVNRSLNSEQEVKKYFNFNPIIDFSKSKFLKKYKNIVQKQATFFVVFKSDGSDENSLLLIENGLLKTVITSKKIQSDIDLFLNKGNSQKGMLLTYSYNKNSILTRKKGSISIDDLFYSDEKGKNRMMELIYIPNSLTATEQNKIESYLSIKYGISLLGNKDYYNSSEDKIWNFKDNAPFNTRVTGIGRDDFFGLNQKQSGNCERDGLYIGFNKLEQINADNKAIIGNKSFLVWGDNNQSTLIAENDVKFKKMKRVWKMQSCGKMDPTQLLIVKDEMSLGNETKYDSSDKFLWLAIDTTQNSKFDYAAAKYIRAKEDDKYISFNGVEWEKDGSSCFTFVKASDFFIINDITATNCVSQKKGSIKVKIVGGEMPYKIHLLSKNYEKEFVLNENHMEIADLSEGDYIIEVTDSQSKIQKNNFTIDGFVDTKIDLSTQLFLDSNHSVVAKPKIDKPEEIQSFEWYQGNSLFSKDNEIVIENTGTYRLDVINKTSCKKSFPFVVFDNDKTASDDWVTFPNPIKTSENFTIRFTLQKKENVSITIYDPSGKSVKQENLGPIKLFEYKDSLRVSGVYLIEVSRNGILQTTKLIVE